MLEISESTRIQLVNESIAELQARPVDKSDPLHTAARGRIARADAIDTCGDVTLAAVWAVRAAMIDGAEAGYVNEWREQSSNEHLGHAWKHVEDASRAMREQERVRSIPGEAEACNDEATLHLTHALCRLAMTILRAEEEQGKVIP